MIRRGVVTASVKFSSTSFRPIYASPLDRRLTSNYDGARGGPSFDLSQVDAPRPVRPDRDRVCARSAGAHQSGNHEAHAGPDEIRHQIHQHPELSNREEKTAALVADYLRKLGLEVRTGVGRHGVVAILKGGQPGSVVAVRADMDALPVTEQTNSPYASKVTTFLGQDVGVMHACGHDIHTAVQLGVASVLVAIKNELPGTVKFIFQGAEEGPPPGEEGGASLMVKEGVLQNPRPQAIFALHAMSEMTVGDVGYFEGPALAGADTWEVKISASRRTARAPSYRSTHCDGGRVCGWRCRPSDPGVRRE